MNRPRESRGYMLTGETSAQTYTWWVADGGSAACLSIMPRPEGWLGSVEFHSQPRPWYELADNPNHNPCFYTGGVCWCEASFLAADSWCKRMKAGETLANAEVWQFLESFMWAQIDSRKTAERKIKMKAST